MRKQIRRTLVVLLVFVIVALMIPITTMTVSATSNMTLRQLQAKFPAGKYWNHAGSSTNNPDGYTDTPCYHHGSCDYYGRCGCNSAGNAIQCFGFANKLAYDAYGSYYTSWSRTTLSNLKAGDVIRYKNDGHSIFVTGLDGDTITYGDCNSDGHCIIRWGATISKSTIAATLTGVYSAPSELTIGDEPDYVNVGDDFYAYIINTDSWLLATNDNGNVNVSKENYNSNQVWHFTRLSNGSYKIVSQKDNSCMEVHNFETQNGTNVEMHPYNDNSAQHWYIYGKSAQYIFRAECGDNVLDLSGGAEGAGNGTNLQMWENNGTNAQKFQIWKLDFPSLGIPNVEVSNYGGTNGDNIKLTWNSCENATGYDVRIYDESGNNNLYMYYNVQGTSFTTRIPSGNYIAEVTALNSMFNTWQFGARTFFSCANNFGTDFYAYIINTDSWLYATNSGKGDVTANTLTGNSNQIWHFERLENGSYKVISCMDNQCMEVHNFESSNGTNVEMHHYDNNSAQHWYIYGESSQYIFRAECGDNVLDLTGGAEGTGNGTNLQMWENNGTNAQKFQLWILDKPNLQAPDVIVQNYLDENDNNIKLSWNGCNDATGYDIRILDENGTDILYMFYNVQGTSFTTKLPQGNYIAEVTALNNRFNIWEYGSRMHFQVKNQIGDTNLDGHITISDVTAIQRHLVELEKFNEEQLALADTNGDGNVDIADATYLQMYLAEYGVVLGKQS